MALMKYSHQQQSVHLKTILTWRNMLTRFCQTTVDINSLHLDHKLITNRLPIIHHHKYVCNLPSKHRFAMRKFHKVLRYLKMDNVITMKQVYEPYEVSKHSVISVHHSDYVERFFSGQTTDKEQRVTGFKWSPGIVSRCRYETGGTILASKMALQYGLACSTGGGTHHAFPSHGSGFCLINDLAIAAHFVIQRNMAQKVLIVDLDVHQGDGTAYIFRNDDRVFTFSMHCENNFPLKKQTSDIDVGLDVGTGDKAYLDQLTEILPSILNTFRPDLILYDAGVDPHYEDELGKLKMTDKGLFDRDFYVMKSAVKRGIPCAAVIGGGYSKDLNELGKRHSIMHRAASKVWNDGLR